MAVVNVVKLRKQAVKAGMSTADARKAKRDELEDFLSNGTKKRKVAKKAVKKAVKKATKKTAKKSVGRKQAPAAKSTKGKAKRPAKNSDVGRAEIGKLDYSNTDGWAPRAGSPVEKIWRSLKKHRDNVDKVFSDLKPRIGDFVHAKKNNGTKRSKAEMEAVLRYRINRTRFQFAVQTGQHSTGTARVKYGTGQYAKARKSAARKAARSSNKKTSTKKSTGRKKARR